MTLEKYKRKAVERPPKTTIEGEAGVGKSFFACSAPKPFVINTDDGIDEILLRIPDIMVADAVPVGDNEANAKLYDSIIDTLTELAKEKHDRKSEARKHWLKQMPCSGLLVYLFYPKIVLHPAYFH